MLHIYLVCTCWCFTKSETFFRWNIKRFYGGFNLLSNFLISVVLKPVLDMTRVRWHDHFWSPYSKMKFSKSILFTILSAFVFRTGYTTRSRHINKFYSRKNRGLSWIYSFHHFFGPYRTKSKVQFKPKKFERVQRQRKRENEAWSNDWNGGLSLMREDTAAELE